MLKFSELDQERWAALLMAAGSRDYVSNFGLRESRRVAEQLTIDQRGGANENILPVRADRPNWPAGALAVKNMEAISTTQLQFVHHRAVMFTIGPAAWRQFLVIIVHHHRQHVGRGKEKQQPDSENLAHLRASVPQL